MTAPDKTKPPMRDPNVDITSPADEDEGISNPHPDREFERPQGPGDTGPELIPPGQIRTGRRDDGGDAGKGDDGRGSADG